VNHQAVSPGEVMRTFAHTRGPEQTAPTTRAIFRQLHRAVLELPGADSAAPHVGSAGQIPPLPRELKTSQWEDFYEREADRIADQVTATPAHSSVGGSQENLRGLSNRGMDEPDTAPGGVDLRHLGHGRSLEPVLRQDMEQRFGHDFSQVRVHSGPLAEESARNLDAHAYTVGRDIVFGPGSFAPDTLRGRRLLAHN